MSHTAAEYSSNEKMTREKNANIHSVDRPKNVTHFTLVVSYDILRESNIQQTFSLSIQFDVVEFDRVNLVLLPPIRKLILNTSFLAQHP